MRENLTKLQGPFPFCDGMFCSVSVNQITILGSPVSGERKDSNLSAPLKELYKHNGS